jgi:hypothetical protein
MVNFEGTFIFKFRKYSEIQKISLDNPIVVFF